jgi:serine phosphatase RsbU (regulator of sigma subunit)
VVTGEGLLVLDEPSRPVGVHRGTKPVVVELPLQHLTTVVLFTDGVLAAGQRRGQALDLPALVPGLCDDCDCDAEFIADQLLTQALKLDEGRASDDISILALTVRPRQGEAEAGWLSATDVRRLALTVPLG